MSDINQTGGGTLIPNNFSSPRSLTAIGSTLFFSAHDGLSGVELWKSDGTITGTVMLRDIHPGAGDSSPANLATVNGTLLFSANDGATGRELWKSRGAATTTVQVQNIAPNAGDSDLASFTIMGANVFFSASNDTAGNELWSISIAALNFAPTTSNQTVATPLNTPISGTRIASDPEGSPLMFSIVTNGSKGVAAIINPTTGAFTYTPNPTDTGNDTFTFTASDGLAASNVATVTVTIGNHVPVANNDALHHLIAGSPATPRSPGSCFDTGSTSPAIDSTGRRPTRNIAGLPKRHSRR